MITNKYHPDFKSVDLESILTVLGEDNFNVFMNRLTKEISLLHKSPVENTAPLKKPTLSLFNYRKAKFYSKPPEKGMKTDMRLVYRFVEETNTLQFLAVGFRRS